VFADGIAMLPAEFEGIIKSKLSRLNEESGFGLIQRLLHIRSVILDGVAGESSCMLQGMRCLSLVWK
jgi:hypothetical protein